MIIESGQAAIDFGNASKIPHHLDMMDEKEASDHNIVVGSSEYPEIAEHIGTHSLANIISLQLLQENRISSGVIKFLKKLNINVDKFLEKFLNSLIRETFISDMTAEDVSMFIKGVICGLDDNMFFGIAQLINRYTPPESNYYFMLGKTSTDAVCQVAFARIATGSAIDAARALSAAGTSGALGLALAETGVGFGFFETAAGIELVESLAAGMVATSATYMSGRSMNILLKDSDKLQKTGRCFTSETLIDAEKGHKPIEELKVGDKVYSENPETGEKGLKEITGIFVNETKTLRHIWVGDKELNTTRKHPFYVIGKGWTEARKLRVGDTLQLFSGEVAVVNKVEDEVLRDPIRVYNFEVADWNTYFVSELDVFVHNCNRYTEVDGSMGQIHHLLSNKIMKKLDRHETLKKIFEREDIRFKYKSKDLESHKGYQEWHRLVDEEIINWLEKNKKATSEEFLRFLEGIYKRPEIENRIPGVRFDLN